MKLRACLRKSFSILAKSQYELLRLQKRSLEEVLEQYFKLLLVSGLLASVMNFVWMLLTATYYKIVSNVTIDYGRLLNYGLSLSAGIFFFYLFAGTFILGTLSLLLTPFLRHKYTEVVKVLVTSMTPVLLFGWIAQRVVTPLLIWSLYLAVIGLIKRKSVST